MIRPLLTALVEYLLAYWIYKKGKVYPLVFASLLFFLASYQFGELILFLTHGNKLGFQIAYFSTTMLPPFGVLFLELTTKRNYYYVIFQGIAVFFAIMFLINPNIIQSYEITDFCIKVNSYSTSLVKYWSYFYQGTLTYTMVLCLYYLYTSKKSNVRRFMQYLFVAYVSFDVGAMIFVRLVPQYRSALASIMCAFAFFAALIFAKMAFDEKLLFDNNHVQEYFESKLQTIKNLYPKLSH